MITLINGCVLFPHRPNWKFSVQHRRIWETEIAGALPGAEQRQSLRAVPRRSVTFGLLPRTLPETDRLNARLDQAVKTGFGCVPLFGRSARLAVNANAGDNVISLAMSGWSWQPGDYLILIGDAEVFDAIAITTVSGNDVTLAAGLTRSWSAGQNCWPLLFGKVSADKQTVLTGWHEITQLTLTELTSLRSVQIGVSPAHIPGVGEQIINSTNTIG